MRVLGPLSDAQHLEGSPAEGSTKSRHMLATASGSLPLTRALAAAAAGQTSLPPPRLTLETAPCPNPCQGIPDTVPGRLAEKEKWHGQGPPAKAQSTCSGHTPQMMTASKPEKGHPEGGRPSPGTCSPLPLPAAWEGSPTPLESSPLLPNPGK